MATTINKETLGFAKFKFGAFIQGPKFRAGEVKC